MNYFKDGKKNKGVQQAPDLLILNFVSVFSIENIKFFLQLKKERIKQSINLCSATIIKGICNHFYSFKKFRFIFGFQIDLVGSFDSVLRLANSLSEFLDLNKGHG